MQQFTPQQQRDFAQKMNAELDRMIMSWDNELNHWYDTAIQTLEHATPASLGIHPIGFVELFNVEKQGLNMNVLSILLKFVQRVTPHQMGCAAKEWAEYLLVNQRVGERWKCDG